MSTAGGSTTQRPHLLVVSDDPELRTFLTEGLLYAGFWTSAVASAIQTLEVFRLRSFDLVLVDAALAGLGAGELVRRLRGRSSRAAGVPRTDIPILLVTDEAPLDGGTVAAFGADDVLRAPLALEELAPRLFEIVAAWRNAHPDRPWADVAALGGSR